MSKHNISKYAMCPFYKHEDAQVIYCEGVQDGITTHLAFASKTEAKEYKRGFCYSLYEKCRVFQMLSEVEDEK